KNEDAQYLRGRPGSLTAGRPRGRRADRPRVGSLPPPNHSLRKSTDSRNRLTRPAWVWERRRYANPQAPAVLDQRASRRQCSFAVRSEQFSRSAPLWGDTVRKRETTMSGRRLFPLALFSALMLSTAVLAQGGGGGSGGGAGGGGGAAGGSAAGTSGAASGGSANSGAATSSPGNTTGTGSNPAGTTNSNTNPD